MAGGTADIFNIAGTHAALTGRHTRTGRLHLAREERLQRRHTCTNQEQGRVILRNQRETRQAKVPFLFCKELQISFAQFVTTHILQTNLPPLGIFLQQEKYPAVIYKLNVPILA